MLTAGQSCQTCTLLTSNIPSSMGHLYKFTTRTDPADAASRTSVASAVKKAALIREAALKSSIFVGVPRVSEPISLPLGHTR